MRLSCVLVSVLVLACGSSGSQNPDGGGDDDSTVEPDGGTSGPKTVKLTLANRPNNAAQFSFFVAYQDGSAPWTVAPAPSGDVYSVSISAPVYGVAWGCIGNVTGTTTTQLRTVTTANFAVAERTELTFDVPARCSDRGGMNVVLSGTVANRPPTGVVAVQFGSRSAFVGTTSGTFSLPTPPGTHDLIVTHIVPEGNGEFYVDEALAIRDVAVTGTTTRSIDFAAAEPTAYYPVDASSPNLQARILATTTLYTGNATQAGLVRESVNCETQSLAQGQMRTTDVYDQAIAVTVAGSSATVTNATNAPGAQTYVAPQPLGAVTSMITSKMPYPIVTTSWPAYGSSVGYIWNATQQLPGQQCGGNGLACTIVWAAYTSPGVTGTMPAYVMPDLTTVMGWSPSFQFAGNAQIVGGVTAETSSAGAGDFPPGTPTSGTKRVFVRTDYGVMP
jgi:hypothetical protein